MIRWHHLVTTLLMALACNIAAPKASAIWEVEGGNVIIFMAEETFDRVPGSDGETKVMVIVTADEEYAAMRERLLKTEHELLFRLYKSDVEMHLEMQDGRMVGNLGDGRLVWIVDYTYAVKRSWM